MDPFGLWDAADSKSNGTAEAMVEPMDWDFRSKKTGGFWTVSIYLVQNLEFSQISMRFHFGSLWPKMGDFHLHTGCFQPRPNFVEALGLLGEDAQYGVAWAPHVARCCGSAPGRESNVPRIYQAAQTYRGLTVFIAALRYIPFLKKQVGSRSKAEEARMYWKWIGCRRCRKRTAR